MVIRHMNQRSSFFNSIVLLHNDLVSTLTCSFVGV